MFENIKSKLPSGLPAPDPRILLAGIALIALAAAVLVAILLWRDQGSYRALYGANEAYPVAEVVSALESEQIAYQLHPQSGQILVKDSQINRARMLLSAKGIKVAVPTGYELFDKDEPLGTSQFVQDVRLKRSLEGELARTIMTLKGVSAARVHLAIQENRSFIVSKKEPAKASITLQLAPGAKLDSEQVGAIIDLTANSVPNLAKTDIAVVDQYGNLLSRGLAGATNPQQQAAFTSDHQEQTTYNAEQVLAAILGRGNYRISVSVDMDFSQREETIQTYGEAPKVRNETVRDESVLDQLALGVPGSLSNNPVNQIDDEPADTPMGAANAAGAADKAATSLRNETNRRFDYDQTITHVKHAPYRLNRQSIAVVINAAAAPEAGFSEADLARLTEMVQTAVGFDGARGDQFSLSVFPFSLSEPVTPPAPLWQSEAFMDLAKLALTLLIALLVIVLILRPAIKSLIGKTTGNAGHALAAQHASLGANGTALPGGFGAANLALGAGLEGALPTPAQLHEPTPGANLLGELNPLAEIRLPAPGTGLEMQIEHLKMLATQDPERVSEVIKQWIGRNERKPS